MKKWDTTRFDYAALKNQKEHTLCYQPFTALH